VAGELYARDRASPFQVSLVLILLTFPLVWLFAPRRDAHTTEAAPLQAD
jgi:hypothetical protein